ncbi:MAG: hypothetical protein PHN82_07225 [bacterium]|nr:hypothetical protein [bacterium]
MSRLAASLAAAVLLQAASPSLAATWGWAPTAPLGGVEDVFRLIRAADGAVYAATCPTGAVFATADGGMTWTRTAEIDGASHVLALLESDGAIYAGTAPNGAVFMTADGGETWQESACFPDAAEVKTLIEAGGAIHAGTGPNGMIYKSSDGGMTWERGGEIAGARFIYCLLEGADGTLYAGADDRVYRSDDGGVTWLPTGGPAGAAYVYTLLETADGALYAGCDGMVHRSDDGGETWLSMGLLGARSWAVFAFAEGEDGTIFAGSSCDGAIHALPPGETAWRLAADLSGLGNIYALLPLPDGTALAAGVRRVMKHGPLLRIEASDPSPAAGVPFEVRASVMPPAGGFTAWGFLSGTDGVYSFDLGRPGILIPGLVPVASAPSGIDRPVSALLFSIPAVPDSAAGRSYTFTAALTRGGAVIPGFIEAAAVAVAP